MGLKAVIISFLEEGVAVLEEFFMQAMCVSDRVYCVVSNCVDAEGDVRDDLEALYVLV